MIGRLQLPGELDAVLELDWIGRVTDDDVLTTGGVPLVVVVDAEVAGDEDFTGVVVTSWEVVGVGHGLPFVGVTVG